MAVGKEVLVLVMVVLCLLLPHKAHSKCQKSYSCRNFTLEFPFTNMQESECGLFAVDGCNSSSTYEHPRLYIGAATSAKYILDQPSRNTFIILDEVFETLMETRSSCYSLRNLSVPQYPSVSLSFSPNITLFTCFNKSSNVEIEGRFGNYSRRECEASTLYYRIPERYQDHGPVAAVPDECDVTRLPIDPDSNSTDLLELLTHTFPLEWNVSEACYQCFNGGGQCLQDNDNKFYCKGTGKTKCKKILFIGAMTIAALTSTLIIISVFIQRKRALARQEHEKDIELFLKNNGHLAPMRYKHSTIKKMTKSFSENLGRGGFGSVYKGQFPDGHPVAVKILHESKGDGEDFMNEVTSISRTSHVNIVALLGFCYEGTKRALIYDFMPNGSLEKFIGNSTASSSVLGWDKLFEIAVGVARGLEYLHQGCNTRILHLDIKPQNILLDKDLNPRISDFGLSKLCPNRSSIVSMLVGRGTIGYIAPEVFSRNYGGVSYKADVYSYGMLVLEMVGGRRNIDRREVDRTSEIYFPQYIYKQLQPDADKDGSDLNGTVDEEDESQVVKRNLMIVGLWCIQTNPKDRPSMTKVVEMLEGKLGPLEVPPKPYLYSPPTSAEQSFSISESL